AGATALRLLDGCRRGSAPRNRSAIAPPYTAGGLNEHSRLNRRTTMVTNGQQPRGVHLVGSFPLGSPEEAFRTPSALLGPHLRRLPDGETGERAKWIMWQLPVLANHPQLQP